jgi:hypothetical protein
VSADASHADHPDSKSHTEDCDGFRGAGGVPDSMLIHVSVKQIIVSKSSCASEIIGQDTMVDYGIWATGVRDDNMSAQMVSSKGHGSFKKMKAVAKRYFYISELIQSGQVKLEWVASKELVADLLNKAVTSDVFGYLLPMLLG